MCLSVDSSAKHYDSNVSPIPVQSSVGKSKIFTTIREGGYGQTICLQSALLEHIWHGFESEIASTWIFHMLISGSKLYGQDYEQSSVVPERTRKLRGYPRLADWNIAAGLTQTNNNVDDS